MILLKSRAEIDCIKASGDILSQVHGIVAAAVRPGITTAELDNLAEEFILDHQAKPSFKGYQGFPATLCVSINDEVVHGVPGSYVLEEGDIVSVDCGVFYQGFHSDSAFTHAVGKVSEKVLSLLQATREALDRGIKQVEVGKRIGDIGFAVQQHVEEQGYTVVRDLVGHGIGRSLHEAPQVPNYGRKGSGPKLGNGMVLAIEPMVNLGRPAVTQDRSGCVRTRDGQPSAHFEHTVALWEGKAELLTTYKYVMQHMEK